MVLTTPVIHVGAFTQSILHLGRQVVKVQEVIFLFVLHIF